MQQPVGEDVPAFRIARELHFVDGEKIHVDLARHRFDRRDPVTRAFGLDLLFARDQSYAAGTHARFDLIVDFACKQAQRQADHAAFVTQHALDGQMRLAGIGGAENCRHVADAGFEVAAHRWPPQRTLLLHLSALQNWPR